MTCSSHHWLIETPDGPTVRGTCKRCGEQRVYPSTFPEDLEVKKRQKPIGAA